MKKYNEFIESINENEFKNEDKFKSYLKKLKPLQDTKEVIDYINSILLPEQIEEFDINSIIATVTRGIVIKANGSYYLMCITRGGDFVDCELDMQVLKKLK